jgi:hypothetical protein
MATLKEFQARTSGRLSKMVEKSPEHAELKKDLQHCVPVYGCIRTCHGDEWGETGGSTMYMYFAGEHRPLCEFQSDTGTVFFTPELAIARVAPLLGIKPEEIKVSSSEIHKAKKVKTIGHMYMDGDEPKTSWDYGFEESRYLWCILYVDQEVFERVHKERHISVIAETGSWMDDGFERIVAPQPVRVKNATFDFDLGLTPIRFVVGHRDCIEYVTQDGIRVFDNRKKVLGIWSGPKGEGKIISRYEAVEEFVRRVCRNVPDKYKDDSKEGDLRRFAASVLSTLAHSPEYLRSLGGLISGAIEALSGSPYFEAGKVFGLADFMGRAISDKDRQKTYQKRLLLKDEDRQDCMDNDNPPNPRYVVVHD